MSNVQNNNSIASGEATRFLAAALPIIGTQVHALCLTLTRLNDKRTAELLTSELRLLKQLFERLSISADETNIREQFCLALSRILQHLDLDLPEFGAEENISSSATGSSSESLSTTLIDSFCDRIYDYGYSLHCETQHMELSSLHELSELCPFRDLLPTAINSSDSGIS